MNKLAKKREGFTPSLFLMPYFFMSLYLTFYTNTIDIIPKEVGYLSDHKDEVAEQAQQHVKNAGKMAGKTASKVASKAVGKASKAALKLGAKATAKGGMLAAKGIMATISAIGMIGVPLLIILGVVAGLAIFTYIGEIESRPVNQNLQSESPQQTNPHDTSSTPTSSTGTTTSISDYNLVVNAFYMNYATKSYQKFYEGQFFDPGEEHKITPSAKRANNKPVTAPAPMELKDESDLEAKFMLSHELLWQLDEYLHDKKFKYPEAFIKPLYHEVVTEGDETKLVLKDLTNEKNEVVAESYVYDEDGNRSTTETTPGVWDYGLSPIISYKTYLEDSRYEYDMEDKTYSYKYTLPDNAIVSGDSHTFTGTLDARLTEDDLKKRAIEDEYLEYKFVNMIDQVLTFVGTFTPQIDYNWQRVGGVVQKFTKDFPSQTLTKKYDITYDRTVPKTTKNGRVYKSVVVGGKTLVEIVDGCQKVVKNDPNYKYVVYNTCGAEELKIYEGNQNVYFNTVMITETVTEKIEVEVTEHITYNKYLAEIKPQYIGEPTISDFKGGSYLQDYIENYESYVPNTVLSDLDLSNRVKQDEETLKEIVEEYETMQANANALLATDDASGVGGIAVGVVSQSAYDNAARYLPYFKKYAEMYGVDPYLLLAKAAQESSGVHEKYLTTERCSGAGCGLMQIEQPGSVVKKVTAYNHQTKQNETFQICKGNSNSPAGCLNVFNVENNIKAGAMQLAQRYKVFNGHHMLSLQSYNFGEGGMRTTVKYCGYDINAVKQDQTDLDWMKCRSTVHLNPTIIDPNWAYAKFGDPVYIENVLKYYYNPETNNVLTYTDSNGTVHSFDTSVISLEGVGGSRYSTTTVHSSISGTTSSGGFASSIGNFLKNNFNKVVSALSNFFQDIPEHFGNPDNDVSHHKANLTPLDIETMETMIFAMEDNVNMDAVGVVSDQMWQDRFSAVFVSMAAQSSVPGFAGEVDPYFNGSARTPLPIEMTPNILYSYREMIQGAHNYGVAVTVPPKTNIHAINDGTVISITDKGDYRGHMLEIQHSNGLVSAYSNLKKSSVKLKEGDTVSKGDVIGIVEDSKNPKQQFFHFELRQNGVPVNPTFLFEDPSGGEFYIPMVTGDFAIPLVNGYVTWEFEDVGYEEHKGIDLGNNGDTTTPVIASADGTVVKTGYDSDGYGNYVQVDHLINGKKFRTVYAHLHSKPLVKKGDIVKQGQKLGTMGNTGNSFGAHLHFEIRDKGNLGYYDTVNPRTYINFPAKKVPW